ncbi:hypothetical protein [Pleomorphomonas sp. PLEO]|uniref:hypothetical protein n=1 Tax=Pleomorphomonas sp. PLEO TaxID=3239306 RepID=UPI00351E14F3
MSKPSVIEVAGKAVAVAAPAGDQVRFVAVKYDVWDLDGELYSSVDEAKRAAARHLAGQGAVAQRFGQNGSSTSLAVAV